MKKSAIRLGAAICLVSASVYAFGPQGKGAGNGAATPLPPIPSTEFPVSDRADLESLYHFAARHADVVDHVPCFCGCGRSAGHTSVSSCFVSQRPTPTTVVWNDHGAHCVVCANVVRDAKEMWNRDLSIGEIRQAIVAKYHKDTMPMTATPEPAPPLTYVRKSHAASR